MFILGDESQHHGKLPWVTGGLILINLFAFCAQQFLGESFTNGFSLVPREITEFRDLSRPEQVKVKVPTHLFYDQQAKQVRTGYGNEFVTVNHYHGPFPIILTLLTSMFLHGDWVHLIGNMWFLAVFGRNVECALDHGRYLAFYVACGLAGGLAHTFSDMASVIPCLGASGAISGIMGAYVAIYPLNKIKVWLGWWIGVIELPALVVVGLWFLFQYVSAFMELETGLSDGVAYWDHLGGFGAGIAIVWGTIFYLKYHQGEQVERSDPVEQTEPAAPDTPSTSLNESIQVLASDPFGDFLPLAKPESTAITVKR